MDAEIAGCTEDHSVGVRVYDNEGYEHQITMTWEGEVDVHAQDRFPHSIEERTDAENAVMSQVEAKAKYTAHQETDADIVPRKWLPGEMERGIEALASCPDETFEEFRPLYEAIQDPPVDAPREEVDVVSSGFTLTDDDEIDEVASVLVGVQTGPDGEDMEMHGDDSPVYPHCFIWHPPATFEWEFGEQFREFLQHNLKCQIRDAYFHMGDEPPEEYRVKGFGKIAFNGMDEAGMDDIRFPHE